jgi:DNA-binding NarL/FixJ family response regulator
MASERPALTPTERRILILVAAGRSNSQIRERLGLGVYSLPRHLNQLYRKSGIHPPGHPYTPAQARQALAEWGRQYLEQEDKC